MKKITKQNVFNLICVIGVFVLSVMYITNHFQTKDEIKELKTAYKKEKAITSQIDYIDNLYIDDYGTLIVE